MKVFYQIAIPIALILGASCSKPNDYSVSPNKELVREWNIAVSSENENHLTTNTTPATGNFSLKLYSDSTVTFDLYVQDYQDKITRVTFNSGNPIEDAGAELVDLGARVVGGYISGGLKLSGGVINNLLTNAPVYVNVLSQHNTTGLLRGQFDVNLVYSQRIALSGNNIVPANPSAVTGTAFLRVTENKTFYSKVTIYGNDPTDLVQSATINRGTTGTNGSFFLTLATSPGGFDTPKITILNGADYETLINDRLYVNVESQNFHAPLMPGGKLRGQIR